MATGEIEIQPEHGVRDAPMILQEEWSSPSRCLVVSKIGQRIIVAIRPMFVLEFDVADGRVEHEALDQSQIRVLQSQISIGPRENFVPFPSAKLNLDWGVRVRLEPYGRVEVAVRCKATMQLKVRQGVWAAAVDRW